MTREHTLKAALESAEIALRSEPHPTEVAFARLLEERRIDETSLREAIAVETPSEVTPAFIGALPFSEFCFERLRHPHERRSEEAVRFALEQLTDWDPGVRDARRRALDAIATRRAGHEQPAARALVLGQLWAVLEGAAPARPSSQRPPSPRRRDELLRETGVDTDSLVLPPLIRASTAFLDKGRSGARERGYYVAFRDLYRRPFGLLDHGLYNVPFELERQHWAGYDASDACLWALDALGVEESAYEACIAATLRSVWGFAGLFGELDRARDRGNGPPAVPLVDFLAVVLLLEVHAIRHVESTTREHRGPSGGRNNHPDAAAGNEASAAVQAPAGVKTSEHDLALVHEAFVLAQVIDVDLELLLDGRHAAEWYAWIQLLGSAGRRRIWQRALERQKLHERPSSPSVHDAGVTAARG